MKKGCPAAMRYLSNQDVQQILPMDDVISALRDAYAGMDSNANTYLPLVYLYAPSSAEPDYYRCSAVIGNSAEQEVVATRIKSEIIGWPGDGTETKYAAEPGLFCGLIILFSTKDARPVAILQDGYIQHMRVGAASALGADVMARTDASTIGILGSGGMARTHLEAMSHVRTITDVRVYSPTQANLKKFVDEMCDAGFPVSAASTPEDAVRDRDIVISATDSIEPTFDAAWLAPGAHVTCISKRELQQSVYDRSDTVARLGDRGYPADLEVPRMQRVRGGLSAFIAGTPEQQVRIPRGSTVQAKDDYPTMAELAATGWRRQGGDDVTLFLTGGTQGVQFAAVAGHALKIAERKGIGELLPAQWFVEDIRN